MKRFLALIVLITFAWSVVQPAMACGIRSGSARCCCPCERQATKSLSCCCRSETHRDASRVSEVPPVDSQVLILPAGPTDFTTLVVAGPSRVTAGPDEPLLVLPPLFVLNGAFLS